MVKIPEYQILYIINTANYMVPKTQIIHIKQVENIYVIKLRFYNAHSRTELKTVGFWLEAELPVMWEFLNTRQLTITFGISSNPAL